MNPEAVEPIFAVTRAIQAELESIWLPPADSTPSRSHSVLDITLVKGTRGYIEIVAHQVNKTYDDTCYDACAVMVRRLVEMLLIEAFEACGVADHAKLPNGEFMYLSDLIDAAGNEAGWNLTRNIKPALLRLKGIGDKSAHDRWFNAKRRDIDKIKDDLRTVVQGLLYLAKLK